LSHIKTEFADGLIKISQEAKWIINLKVEKKPITALLYKRPL